MKYLLDVNALIALAHSAHPLNARAEKWFRAQGSSVQFYTCSITEIGFLRVTLNARLKIDLPAAQIALAGLLVSPRFTRVADNLGGDSLPSYVKKAADVTDGHLLELAKRHGAKLATLDVGIPGSELIT